MIVLALGPPLLAWGWREYRAYLLRTAHVPMSGGVMPGEILSISEWTTRKGDDGVLYLDPPK
jgi:hypothetical protein